ncbi:MAG: AI-2E family transporter, partial [Deltaproteobacteria bacterium]|nr:AI-2E family transporter [Deltaproteobacteria bacterium]
LVLGALIVGWSLLPALILAAWTAALARPLWMRLESLLKGRTRAAATATLLVFVAVSIPVILLGVFVVSEADGLVASLSGAPSARAALETLTSSAPSASLPRSLDEVVALVGRYGAQAFQLGSRIASLMFKGAIALFVYFAGVYSLMLGGDDAWRWLQAHVPLAPAALERLKGAFYETGRGLLLGVGLTTVTQGLIATIVYLLLGVPRAWVLGPLTGIAAIVPLVGTSLVWAPIGIGFLLAGEWIKGAVLIGLGVAVISVVDNVLRPIYVRFGALQMPMLVIFVAILGGVALLGPVGAILGPVIVRLAKEALAIARDRREGRVARSQP